MMFIPERICKGGSGQIGLHPDPDEDEEISVFKQERQDERDKRAENKHDEQDKKTAYDHGVKIHIDSPVCEQEPTGYYARFCENQHGGHGKRFLIQLKAKDHLIIPIKRNLILLYCIGTLKNRIRYF
ncbi:MAG: hypothetical protein ACYCWE_09010 [Eubacteriales bacterium]